MSLDKSELRFLINELKQVFATKKEIEKIKDIIDEPPVYNNPKASVTVNPVNILQDKLTEIKIVPKFIQNDAGELIKVVIKRDGEILYESDVLDGIIDYVEANHNTNIKYTVEVFYSDGIIKNSSLGIPYPDNSVKEGSITSEAIVKAYAPSYYGPACDVDLNNLSKILNPTKKYTFNNITLNAERFIYAYPSSFGEITSIKDANNFEYINSYTKSKINFNDIEYLVYILTDPVSISGFKQIFS